MKLIHLIAALLSLVLVSSSVDIENREKRQAAPIAIPAAAGVAAVAFWSLVTLRLMSVAARLNNQAMSTTPLPPPPPPPPQPGFFRINLNLNAPTTTTTQRSGYFNAHVKKREATSTTATPQIDVDKMLELIRKLDKANCIPKLVCQLHTPNAQQKGLFEKSIIKFVAEYNGPAMQRGSAGALLKASALLGQTTKSEQKCQEAFPHCPITASQMAEVLRTTKV